MPVTVAFIGLAGVLLGGLLGALLERAEDRRRGMRANADRVAEKAHQKDKDDLRRVHRQRLFLMRERLEAYAAVLAEVENAERALGTDPRQDSGDSSDQPSSLDPFEIEASLKSAIQIALLLAASDEVRGALVTLEDAAIARHANGGTEASGKARRAANHLRDAVRAEIGLRSLHPAPNATS